MADEEAGPPTGSADTKWNRTCAHVLHRLYSFIIHLATRHHTKPRDSAGAEVDMPSHQEFPTPPPSTRMIKLPLMGLVGSLLPSAALFSPSVALPLLQICFWSVLGIHGYKRIKKGHTSVWQALEGTHTTYPMPRWIMVMIGVIVVWAMLILLICSIVQNVQSEVCPPLASKWGGGACRYESSVAPAFAIENVIANFPTIMAFTAIIMSWDRSDAFVRCMEEDVERRVRAHQLPVIRDIVRKVERQQQAEEAGHAFADQKGLMYGVILYSFVGPFAGVFFTEMGKSMFYENQSVWLKGVVLLTMLMDTVIYICNIACLYGLHQMYRRNQVAMRVLGDSRLWTFIRDASDKASAPEMCMLFSWWKSRQHIVRYRLRLVYDIASWGVAFTLLVNVVLIGYIVYQGLNGLERLVHSPGTVNIELQVVTITLLTFLILKQAVQIYTESQLHDRALMREQMKPPPHKATGIAEQDSSKVSSCNLELNSSMREFIREHDDAPAVFGFKMKPNLLLAFNGYVFSAATALVAKYLSGD